MGTVIGVGAGTVIAGPIGFLVGVGAKKGKTVDTRELYLFVEGEDWADSTNCDPGKEGQKVREFAQKVNLAARNVERVKGERERRLRELTEQLAAAEGDRTGIESAERTRAALGPGARAAGKLHPETGSASTPES